MRSSRPDLQEREEHRELEDRQTDEIKDRSPGLGE